MGSINEEHDLGLFEENYELSQDSWSVDQTLNPECTEYEGYGSRSFPRTT
jgi:hypothetical protein